MAIVWVLSQTRQLFGESGLSAKMDLKEKLAHSKLDCMTNYIKHQRKSAIGQQLELVNDAQAMSAQQTKSAEEFMANTQQCMDSCWEVFQQVLVVVTTVSSVEDDMDVGITQIENMLRLAPPEIIPDPALPELGEGVADRPL